jgi:hypothetical protein
MEGVKWVKSDRRQQSNAISEMVKQIVIRCWTKDTKVRPNVKDVIHHWISTNNWEKHVIHFLQESQVFLSP